MAIKLNTLGNNQAVILRRVLQDELRRVRLKLPYVEKGGSALIINDIEDIEYLLSQLKGV